MPFLAASITGPIVNAATHVIGSLGLAGVAIMTTTTGVIGLPGTEPTMLFAGFDVYRHVLSLPGIIVFGVLGDMLGASIAYAIGFWGETQLIERHGTKLHLGTARLGRATGWFERYGSPAIFISRLIPGARAAFPYGAGVVKMPFVRFFVFALAGSIIWISALAVVGREVGADWRSWRNHLEYVDYAFLALVVLAVIYLVLRRVRANRAAAVDAVPD